MMSKIVHFTKMHGAGNDYIYVNTLLYDIPSPSATSIKWSAFHTGIGSDGLILIGKPSIMSGADFSMRIFNADGSEAMMCGNGSRCVGKYLYEKGLTDKTEIKLETLSGVKILRLKVNNGKVENVTVDMLEPRLSYSEQFDAAAGEELKAGLRSFRGTFVSMGNPHYVIFTDGVEDLDIAKYGSLLERDKAFPQRCNIEFAQLIGKDEIRTRVWERGSGITMACGTGACATAVAAFITGRASRSSKIKMDGGTLDITWDEQSNHVFLSGPSVFVYEGDIEL